MAIQEINIVGNDGTAPPGVGLPLRVATVPTALGPALVVNASFTGTIEVNLDLANDEVAIGGPDAVGTRRLFRGVDNGDGTNTMEVSASGTVAVGPTVTPGTGAANLGKAEDAVAANGDVGVMALSVRRDTPAANAADGDYAPQILDAVGATWIRERKPDTVPLGTAVNVALVQISLGAANADRFTVTFFNNGTNTVYIGPTGVLVANGMPLLRGASITLEATIEWFAIAAVAGPTEVRVLEQSY
jgi:hypothetical protein